MQCPGCDLYFVPSQDQLTPENERARYQTHRNDLGQRGFRDFLMTTVELMKTHVPAPAAVLDYGSGPEPSLATLLSEAGYDVSLYDPFFHPGLPSGPFDIVLMHEVFEHVRDPRAEIEAALSRLKTGGRLVIRTELRPVEFQNWWYARDNTHILFPSEATMAWIAGHWSLQIERWSPVVTALALR